MVHCCVTSHGHGKWTFQVMESQGIFFAKSVCVNPGQETHTQTHTETHTQTQRHKQTQNLVQCPSKSRTRFSRWTRRRKYLVLSLSMWSASSRVSIARKFSSSGTENISHWKHTQTEERTRKLPSSEKLFLFVPRMMSVKTFSVSAPSIWNSLS